jgi:polysaccharide biosynthesis/export protein
MPYTLDSGDRLRVVVFGQDGLSNTYIVDATGKPLIGAVPARGCTTGQLAKVIADKLRNGYVREPHELTPLQGIYPNCKEWLVNRTYAHFTAASLMQSVSGRSI